MLGKLKGILIQSEKEKPRSQSDSRYTLGERSASTSSSSTDRILSKPQTPATPPQQSAATPPIKSAQSPQTQTQTQTNTPITDHIFADATDSSDLGLSFKWPLKGVDENPHGTLGDDLSHLQHAHAGTDLLARYVAQRAEMRKNAAENAKKAAKTDEVVSNVAEKCNEEHNSLKQFTEELKALPKIKEALGTFAIQIGVIIAQVNALEEMYIEEQTEKMRADSMKWRQTIEEENADYHSKQQKHVRQVTEDLKQKRHRIQKQKERDAIAEQKRVEMEKYQKMLAEQAERKKNISYSPFVVPLDIQESSVSPSAESENATNETDTNATERNAPTTETESNSNLNTSHDANDDTIAVAATLNENAEKSEGGNTTTAEAVKTKDGQDVEEESEEDDGEDEEDEEDEDEDEEEDDEEDDEEDEGDEDNEDNEDNEDEKLSV